MQGISKVTIASMGFKAKVATIGTKRRGASVFMRSNQFLDGYRIMTVFTLLFMASHVRAGDNSRCVADKIEEYPKNGEQEVPLNPILVYHQNVDQSENYDDPYVRVPSLYLEDAEKNAIMVTERWLIEKSPGCLLVYTPTELLLPNTEYWVRFSTTKDLKEWGHNDVYFRTGDAVDSIGPSYTVGADKDSGWVFDADFSSSEPILIVSTYVCESMGCYGTGTTPSDSTLYIQYAGTDNVLELTAWDRAGNHKTIRTSARYQGNTQGGCAVVHTNSQSAAPIVLTVLITIAALYLYARRKRAAQYT